MMIDELRAMAIFAKTVELGSFRACAEALHLAPSVISHHIGQLEERLGCILLYRSTRHISLTDDGRILFAAAQEMLKAAQNGLGTLTGKPQEPSGRLRITVGAFFSQGFLLERLAAFAKAFPRVELQIEFSDHAQNLVREGIDFAIRTGDLEDSALRSQKLFVIKRELVASPDFLRGKKKARAPEDLKTWEWIGLATRPHHRVLIHEQEQRKKVDFNPRIVVDSVTAALQLALAGSGLATPPRFLIEAELKARRLVRALPGWVPEPLTVYGVWPAQLGRDSLALKLKNFLIEPGAIVVH